MDDDGTLPSGHKLRPLEMNEAYQYDSEKRNSHLFLCPLLLLSSSTIFLCNCVLPLDFSKSERQAFV